MGYRLTPLGAGTCPHDDGARPVRKRRGTQGESHRTEDVIFPSQDAQAAHHEGSDAACESAESSIRATRTDVGIVIRASQDNLAA